MKLFSRDTLYVLGISILVILFLFQKCSHNRELKDYRGKLLSMSIDNQNYVTEIDENGNEIATQNQLILTQKETLDKLGDELDRYKKVASYVDFGSETKIDSILIPYEVEVVKWMPMSEDSLAKLAYIQTPLPFSKKDDWYGIKGKVLSNGIFFDSIKFYNKSKVIVGTESQGWFKKPIPIVSIENENPYTSITSMQNIQVEDRRKFYDKKSFWFGTGVVIGFAIPTIINLNK